MGDVIGIFMKILVTGTDGYLIRNMKTCFFGHEMCFVVRKNATNETKSPLRVEADIRDFDKFEKVINSFVPDVILHAAAKISIKECDTEDLEMYETNVEGTRNIMKLAPSGSTVIFISSMTVYSKNDPSPVSEDALCVPPHFYGFTKLIGEQIVKYYANCRKVNHLILRLPGLYGGDRKDGYIYNTISKALQNKDIIIKTDGLLYWQTISVDEVDKVLGLFLKMIQSNQINDTFNVCHDEDTDFITTAQYIVNKLGSTSMIFVEQPIGYGKFPLSNQKMTEVFGRNPVIPYYESLNNYIETKRGAVCES